VVRRRALHVVRLGLAGRARIGLADERGGGGSDDERCDDGLEHGGSPGVVRVARCQPSPLLCRALRQSSVTQIT